MKCFISYSTADRAIAGDLHRQLSDHSIESFIAHEKIEVSADWKERILAELAHAEAMIILLSRDCRSSDWTGHEAGYFYAKSEHRGLIIPISLDDTVSFGMFSRIQSQRVPAGARAVPLEFWLPPIVRSKPSLLIPVVIDKLAACSWCRTSEAYMRILRPHFSTMLQADLDRLMAAAVMNRDFYSATECRMTLLPALVQANSGRLSQEQIALLQKKLDDDESFATRVALLPRTTQQRAIQEVRHV